MAYKAVILCVVRVPLLDKSTTAIVELNVQDKLTTVSSLCEQLDKHLRSLTNSNLVFKVLGLRWRGSACEAANPVRLYVEHGSSSTEQQPTTACFTATVTAVPPTSRCVLRITNKASIDSGGSSTPSVLDVGSPYTTVDSLRQQLLKTVPGLKTLDGLLIIHQGERMTDGNKLLTDYLVQDTGRIQDIIIVRAESQGSVRSAVAFADISKDEALKKIQFDDSAPEWRRVAAGLNIEGRCRNMLCKAYNNIVIDPSHGLHNPCHHFDLLLKEKSCPCPICKEPIELDTCGLYNCKWMYSGIERMDGGIKHKTGEWRVAGDETYERFDGAKAGNRAEWESLMILTCPRPASGAPSVCCVWEVPIPGCSLANGEGRDLSCGHSVHIACLASTSNGSTCTSCPTCGNATPDPSLAGPVAAAVERLRPEAELIPLLEALKAAVDPVQEAVEPLLNHLKQ